MTEEVPCWSWLWSRDSLAKVCASGCTELPGHPDLERGVCGPCGIKLAAIGEEPLSKTPVNGRYE